MKIIKYKFLSSRINHGTEKEPEYEDVVLPQEIRCSEASLAANLEIARSESYKGEEPIVEDDGQPDPSEQPTQLDRVEAQATYTAMMTDTLLEV